MNCYLTLNRCYYRDNYIIGKLFVNEEYYCDTLEPCEKSVHGCVSPGVYDVSLNITSPKFVNRSPYRSLCKGKLPRLLGTRNNSILIHIGNYPSDTEGCILVGYNKSIGAVLQSTQTFTKLYKHLIDPFYDKVILSINETKIN